jgi:hypothetical protein
MSKKDLQKARDKQKFKEWYSKPENKKKMQGYMKKYYKNNRDSLLIYQKEVRRNYNQPLKNLVRENIIKQINNYKIKSILTLESPEFLFSKLIPEKKVIVFEHNKDTFKLMEKTKPKNVKLFFGDISESSNLNVNVDMVYLDFQSNWSCSKESIYLIKEIIKNSKLFAITLTTRDNQLQPEGDYQFYYISQLQEMLGNLKVLYGEAYKDSSNMVTIIFEVIKEND